MNKHGDPVRPVLNQPAIEPADFEVIPELTRVGSYRVLGAAGSRKAQRIEYRGEVRERRYVYTEIVGTSRRRLALQSFYRME